MFLFSHRALSRRNVACAAGLCAIVGSSLFAKDLSSLDQKFFDALIKRNWLRQANVLVDSLTEQHGKELPDLQFMQLRLFIAADNTDAAGKLVDQLVQDKDLYGKALAIMATESTSASKRIDYYRTYFEKAPRPNKDDEVEAYRSHILNYVELLQREGKFDDAIGAARLMVTVGEANRQVQRHVTLLEGQILLEKGLHEKETNPSAKEGSGKKAVHKWKKKLEAAEQKLLELVFIQDYFATLAYPALMQIQNELGDPDKAEDTFNASFGLLKKAEDEIAKRTKNLSASPVAPAIFQLGQVYFVRAKQARAAESKTKDKAKKKKLFDETGDHLNKAASYYFAVTSKYPDAPQAREAASQFELVSALLKKVYGRTIKMGETNRLEMLTKAGVNFFQEGNFGAAASKFAEAVEILGDDKENEELPKSLYLASMAYLQDGQTGKAEAFVARLVDDFADYPNTGKAALSMGAILSKQAKGLTGDEKDALESKAQGFFRQFVKLSPSDPKAPQIAYLVAEASYSNATSLRQQAKELSAKKASDDQIRPLLEKMQIAFKEAIPLYTEVLDHFDHTDYAVKSLQKLGWIYQTLGELSRSGRYFEFYSERTTDPSEAMRHTYFAASNYMRGDDPEKAIALLVKVLTETDKDGKWAGLKEAAKTRQDAHALQPWAYDKQASLISNKIATLREQLTDEALEAEDKKAIESTIESLKTERRKLQDESLQFFKVIVEKQPKSESAALAMAKMGAVYANRQDYDTAAKWLSRLEREFPGTEAAVEATFSLFRAYVETDNAAKAKEVANRLQAQLPGFNVGTLSYVAGQLLERTEKYEYACLAPELVLAANRELIKRASGGGEDSDKAKKLLPRSNHYEAIALRLSGQYDDAIKEASQLIDQYGKTSYLFSGWLEKGRSFLALGKAKEALHAFDTVLTYADRDKNPTIYYEALAYSIRVLNSQKDERKVKDAAVRGLVVLEMSPPFDSKELSIWVQAVYVEAARSFSLLGREEKASETQQAYLAKFLDGAFRREILSLPAKAF